MAAVYVELSHEISDGMSVFPGLPSPRITAFMDHEQSRARYQGQAEFYITSVELVGNTGTYIDSPFHRHRDERDLSAIPLDREIDPGKVFDLELSLDEAAAGYQAMDERRAIKALLRP